MSPEDTARCQQAIMLANSGQKRQAYEQFRALHHQGNTEDVTLLYWLACTTPYRAEARRTMGDIERVEPNHPNLPRLRDYVGKWGLDAGRVLTCPYCHSTGPARIPYKLSLGGVVWFFVFFLLFIACLLALIPISEVWVLLLIGILGLLAIRKRVYVCGQCGIALGDIAH